MMNNDQENICANLENWMTNLPKQLKSVPLIHLAIPGSHDSFTSNIKSTSKISPDAGNTLKRLKWLGPLLGYVVRRWVRTQEFDVAEQLQSGIRYFDLRIATKDNTEQLFFVHGQYSVDVVSVLNDIENFLDTNLQEVVILDCQHFYEFTSRDHNRLIQLLKATFGVKLLPYSVTMNHLTLDFITERYDYQVILIYRSDKARFNQPFLWPAASFPTPWPDTVCPSKLMSKLNEGLQYRPQGKAFISQCLLTPTSSFIFKKLCGCLKSTCVLPLQKIKYNWLSEQIPGPHGVNVVIADFVDMDCAKFSKFVIGLNEKLLDASLNEEEEEVLPPVD